MNRERTVSITPRTLALDGMFTALLILLGMIKLPSILPGAEFQQRFSPVLRRCRGNRASQQEEERRHAAS